VANSSSIQVTTMYTDTVSVITSRRNQRVVEARKLQQRKHRERQGRFLVEGSQLLQMALDGGVEPVEVFFCEEQCGEAVMQALLSRFREARADLVPVSSYVMEVMSERSNSQTIVATFTRFETAFQNIDPGEGRLIIVVDRPQSPPNLGMIFRTADAVGAAAVILIQPCVDPFHPMTVRVSLGTLFSVPFAQTLDVTGLFVWLQQEGFKPVGTDPYVGTWDQDIWKGKVALILGSNVRGMSEDMHPWVEDWARLPMVGKVESLSSAVAGSVLMYDWLRVNCNP
jgi:TrmH family RNA methyltransferase